MGPGHVLIARTIGMFGDNFNLTLITYMLQVCKSLSDPATRPGTLEVFRYMLLSYQHSSQAFHTTLPVLVPLVRRLRSQDPVPAKFLDALACLCHTMMFKFPGYPLLYADLLEWCVTIIAIGVSSQHTQRASEIFCGFKV